MYALLATQARDGGRRVEGSTARFRKVSAKFCTRSLIVERMREGTPWWTAWVDSHLVGFFLVRMPEACGCEAIIWLVFLAWRRTNGCLCSRLKVPGAGRRRPKRIPLTQYPV